MQTPTPLLWEQLNPAQRLRVIAILVQMLLRHLIAQAEAQDESGG
jgi:hypothetical protein